MRVSILLKPLIAIALFVAISSCDSNKPKVKAHISKRDTVIDDSISRKAGVNAVVPEDTIKYYNALYSRYDGRYQFNSLRESKTAVFKFAGKNKISFQLFSCTSYLNSITDEGLLTMNGTNIGYFVEPKQFHLDFMFSDSVVTINERRDTSYQKHPDLSFGGVYIKTSELPPH